jgi:hypothetical protein
VKKIELDPNVVHAISDDIYKVLSKKSYVGMTWFDAVNMDEKGIPHKTCSVHVFVTADDRIVRKIIELLDEEYRRLT